MESNAWRVSYTSEREVMKTRKLQDIRDVFLTELQQNRPKSTIEFTDDDLKSIVDTLNRAIKDIHTIYPLRVKEAYRLGSEMGSDETIDEVLELLEDKRIRVINNVLYNEIKEELCRMKLN